MRAPSCWLGVWPPKLMGEWQSPWLDQRWGTLRPGCMNPNPKPAGGSSCSTEKVIIQNLTEVEKSGLKGDLLEDVIDE